MSGRSSAVPTRASSRIKTTATTATSAIPTTTRTTRRTATTASTKATPSPTATTVLAPVKKTTIRKPLSNSSNSLDVAPAAKPKAKPAATRKAATKQPTIPSASDREPIMAYLRIRPHLGEDEPMSTPYLTPLSDTSVRMTDPQDPQNNRSRFRPSTVPPASTYTFSHVFPPNTTQSDFFTKTTLPLVADVLQGQNGLLFTYGVTNSGKTYTVQGGSEEGAAGILPRTLDVIFNSIEGLHGDGKYRPVRLHGVELADPNDSKAPEIPAEPALVEVLGQQIDTSAEPEFDIDPTTLKVDRNYEYTIWLSYAEVYNEKVYDLLASVKDGSNINANGTVPGAANKSLLLTRQALPLRPSPASDNMDSDANGKYIAGLRQFRVHSTSQAKALVKLGQLHRRVFGTLANRESSRSHGMVIIKVVRGHRGERDDPTSLQISRLTLVDLAGSERTKHTHTTGERLKEAGNINKSLMVLGQCMEVMRSNQRKVAISLSQEGVGKDGRMDTRDVKKALGVVPFRHSKLTEALMDYFIGDGRTVMIVNVNPYDTGYDENSHVMKFAALAREVYITPAPAPVQRVPSTVWPGKMHGNKIKELGPMTLKDAQITPNPYRRKVTISIGGGGRKASETILEVVEEEEPADEQDDDGVDGDSGNSLVDELFDEIEYLRMQLFESEMRCATIEAEVREEVMREMEERMMSVERMYSRRLMSELEQNEMKTDAKIDMLHQSGLFGSPAKKQQRTVIKATTEEEEEEEEDVEMSLIGYRQTDDSEEENEDRHADFLPSSDRSRSMSMSPLAGKGKARSVRTSVKRASNAPKVITEIREFIPDPPMLPSDTEEAELTETEDGDDGTSVAEIEIAASEDEDEDEEEVEEVDSEYTEDEEEEEEEEWAPSTTKAPKAKVRAPSPQPVQASPVRPPPFKPVKNPRVSKLEREMSDLNISETPDDSVVILPVKKFRVRTESTTDAGDEDEDEDDEVFPIKKKKRQLGKKPVRTEEDIEKATYAVEKQVMKTQASKIIKRLGGRG
ncbi:P-loop containing nucleoside triphosphate hydrolase protein [Crucibulum laeve]|uniref:P-loop containing nucleoside triphosphate hydrolase protein n=1 Tax=Crucibulum laeve TaxID=68775 RepID=A0A5C3MBT3_9AGAR|nr:P-loop containing nucleoside triphosphate hydrolase protein [Crucibulum laeve]